MASINLKRADVQKLVDFCAEHDSPTWFIAKDEGAYVGHSVGERPEQQCLWYFKGCDPKKNEDYYETCRRLFGGDDFGEELPIADLKAALALPEMKHVKVTCTKTSVRVESFCLSSPAQR